MHRLGSLELFMGRVLLEMLKSHLCCTVQFHTWLTTGIPDGQPKMLLTFLPYEDFPLLNFGMATASKSTLPTRGSGLLPCIMHLIYHPGVSMSKYCAAQASQLSDLQCTPLASHIEVEGRAALNCSMKRR